MLVEDILLKDVAFFSIDQTMRAIRQHSMKAFLAAGFDVTIDQWLVLKKISDSDGYISQTEVAEMLGKEAASMTRIIDILVKKNYVFRRMNADDRRRFDLVMTDAGTDLVKRLIPLVKELRAAALAGISDAEILVLKSVLAKITANIQ